MAGSPLVQDQAMTHAAVDLVYLTMVWEVSYKRTVECKVYYKLQGTILVNSRSLYYHHLIFFLF